MLTIIACIVISVILKFNFMEFIRFILIGILIISGIILIGYIFIWWMNL